MADEDKPKGRVDLERMRMIHDLSKAYLASDRNHGRATLRAVAKLAENFHVEGRVGKFHLESDESIERGGNDLGPSPLQYFLIGAAF